jgi:hypothetical protein
VDVWSTVRRWVMGCRRRWLDGRYVVIWAVGRFGWCDLGGVRFGRCGDLGLWRDLGMVRSGWYVVIWTVRRFGVVA